MHRSARRRQAALALRDHPQQEEHPHTRPPRKEKIQPAPQAPHPAPGNQVTCSQKPHRPRRRSRRLQKSRTPQTLRHRKRQDSPPPCDGHVRPHAPQNHPRNQTCPGGSPDEIKRVVLADNHRTRGPRVPAFAGKNVRPQLRICRRRILGFRGPFRL